MIHAVGIMVFGLRPALASDSWTTGLLFGALVGFCAYATYDITNLATLRGWPAAVAVVDIVWGTITTALAMLAAFIVVRVVEAA